MMHARFTGPNHEEGKVMRWGSEDSEPRVSPLSMNEAFQDEEGNNILNQNFAEANLNQEENFETNINQDQNFPALDNDNIPNDQAYNEQWNEQGQDQHMTGQNYKNQQFDQQGHEGEFYDQEGHEGEFQDQEGHEGEFQDQEGHEGEFHDQEGHEGEFQDQEGREGEFHDQEGREGEFHQQEGQGLNQQWNQQNQDAHHDQYENQLGRDQNWDGMGPNGEPLDQQEEEEEEEFYPGNGIMDQHGQQPGGMVNAQTGMSDQWAPNGPMDGAEEGEFDEGDDHFGMTGQSDFQNNAHGGPKGQTPSSRGSRGSAGRPSRPSMGSGAQPGSIKSGGSGVGRGARQSQGSQKFAPTKTSSRASQPYMGHQQAGSMKNQDLYNQVEEEEGEDGGQSFAGQQQPGMQRQVGQEQFQHQQGAVAGQMHEEQVQPGGSKASLGEPGSAKQSQPGQGFDHVQDGPNAYDGGGSFGPEEEEGEDEGEGVFPGTSGPFPTPAPRAQIGAQPQGARESGKGSLASGGPGASQSKTGSKGSQSLAGQQQPGMHEQVGQEHFQDQQGGGSFGPEEEEGEDEGEGAFPGTSGPFPTPAPRAQIGAQPQGARESGKGSLASGGPGASQSKTGSKGSQSLAGQQQPGMHEQVGQEHFQDQQGGGSFGPEEEEGEDEGEGAFPGTSGPFPTPAPRAQIGAQPQGARESGKGSLASGGPGASQSKTGSKGSQSLAGQQQPGMHEQVGQEHFQDQQGGGSFGPEEEEGEDEGEGAFPGTSGPFPTPAPRAQIGAQPQGARESGKGSLASGGPGASQSKTGSKGSQSLAGQQQPGMHEQVGQEQFQNQQGAVAGQMHEEQVQPGGSKTSLGEPGSAKQSQPGQGFGHVQNAPNAYDGGGSFGPEEEEGEDEGDGIFQPAAPGATPDTAPRGPTGSQPGSAGRGSFPKQSLTSGRSRGSRSSAQGKPPSHPGSKINSVTGSMGRKSHPSKVDSLVGPPIAAEMQQNQMAYQEEHHQQQGGVGVVGQQSFAPGQAEQFGQDQFDSHLAEGEDEEGHEEGKMIDYMNNQEGSAFFQAGNEQNQNMKGHGFGTENEGEGEEDGYDDLGVPSHMDGMKSAGSTKEADQIGMAQMHSNAQNIGYETQPSPNEPGSMGAQQRQQGQQMRYQEEHIQQQQGAFPGQQNASLGQHPG